MDVKCQPAAETWDGDFKVETGGFELGPIKPWIDVSDFGRNVLTRFFYDNSLKSNTTARGSMESSTARTM